MNWRSEKQMVSGIITVGCSHGFSNNNFWKNDEHADKTTYN